MKKVINIITALIAAISLSASPCFAYAGGESVDLAEPLNIGEEKVCTFIFGEEEASPHCWFTFTPDKDGTYQFNFTNIDTKNVFSFTTRLYDSKMCEEYIECDGDCYFSGKEYKEINPHFVTYTMKGGTKYYLDVYTLVADGVDSIEASVSVIAHTHSFEDFFRKPALDDSGEYGKVCSGCGYETNIKCFNRPVSPKLTKLIGGNKRLMVKWSRVKNAEGYQLQYSTSKRFTKKKTETKTVKKASSVKYAVKNLKKKKTYYVRVRSYKIVKGHKVYSRWSKIKSQKTS